MPVTKDDCLHCFGTGQALSNVEIGKRLRLMRIKGKFSQAGIAGVMGKSSAYLAYLENGKREWSGELIKAYLKALK
jgi:transcriptional regulator with XRE-family HTH domain